MAKRVYVIALDSEDEVGKKLEEALKEAEAPDEPVERIMPSEDVKKGAIEVFEMLNGGKSAEAKSPPDASASDGASASATKAAGDAYTEATLTAALGSPVDAKVIWDEIHDGDSKKGLARELTENAAEARIALLEKSAWATAPELALLEECPATERPYLARKILKVRTGISGADIDRRYAENDLARQKVASARVANQILGESLTQMKAWTALAELGKNMLIFSTIFSMAMIIAVIVFASESKIGEAATPIIIFVLAIFAISPAVLLLRERPLEGLDKFTPGGSTGGDSGSGGGSDAGGGEGGTAAASGGSGGS